MERFYTIDIAGLKRDLPLCKAGDNLYIGAFVMFSDVELTVKAASALLEKAPEFDVILKAFAADKKIAVFGFAFKSDTSDTRESPAIAVCTKLLNEQAHIAIHDPKALENAKTDLADAPADRIAYCSDPYEAADGAHALVFLTDWKCFRELDFKRIFQSMRHPAFIFDGRNFLDHETLYSLGYHVYPIGRPAMSHFEQKD